MPLPPGPEAPAALQIVRWLHSPYRLLAENRTRFGDSFTMRFPGLSRPIVILSDPAAVKDLFALGPDEGHAGKANFVLKPFLGEHSLLLLDGAEHMRQRKMMLPAFHGERMHGYGRTMMEVAHASIDAWPIGRRFAVHRPMQQITLQVIVRTVFGVEAGPRFSELADTLTRALDIAAWPMLLFPFMQRDLGSWSPWGRFSRLAARAGEILRAEIRRGRAEGTAGRSDVLAMMLEARDEAGQPLTEDEIHDELVTLLIAGHETTATALAWAMRWILPETSLVSRLREEIATAGGDPLKLSRLELLDATVKESLRLQPIIPLVGRVLQQPTKLGRWELPANTAAAAAIYLIHRHPALYPDAERFRPERFSSFKPAAWEWIPFGGGLRRCIGASFAVYEMKMVLASLLPRLDMRIDAARVRPSRRGITITPSEGLPVVVTARRSRHVCANAA